MGVNAPFIAWSAVVIKDDFLVQLLQTQLNHPFAFSSESMSASTSSFVLYR
jgi:hypothetical protein